MPCSVTGDAGLLIVSVIGALVVLTPLTVGRHALQRIRSRWGRTSCSGPHPPIDRGRGGRDDLIAHAPPVIWKLTDATPTGLDAATRRDRRSSSRWRRRMARSPQWRVVAQLRIWPATPIPVSWPPPTLAGQQAGHGCMQVARRAPAASHLPSNPHRHVPSPLADSDSMPSDLRKSSYLANRASSPLGLPRRTTRIFNDDEPGVCDRVRQEGSRSISPRWHLSVPAQTRDPEATRPAVKR